MTKLMEWLLFVSLFFGIWIATVSGIVQSSIIIEWQQTILFLPLIFLFIFGIYAIMVILYRVFTFNNCEDAAVELKQQIEDAKLDLRSKGIKLK